MKFHSYPVGTNLFHADGQTDRQRGRDRTKLIVTFCNSVRAPKNKQKQEV